MGALGDPLLLAFSGKAQLVAIIVTAILLGIILELVRRRRLAERYALLWMSGAVALLILALWGGLLDELASALGIENPPNALFLVGFGVIFVLLLHFSVANSRLGEETKILAQEVARLDLELRRSQNGPLPPGGGIAPQRPEAGGEDPAPSSSLTSDQ